MFLFCDTDCLIQIFITDEVSLLKWLKAKYGLEAIVVPEVENEITWHRKFKDRFESDLRRAVTAEVIATFDYSHPELQLSRVLPVTQAATVVRAILDTGRNYAMRVQPGEAYSHAACIHLDAPLLSHDRDAVRVLEANKLKTAAPTLRVFDLIALAYQKNARTLKDCDTVRQTLYAAREFLPRVFSRASFEDGIKLFDQRLRDLADWTGGGDPPTCKKFNEPYYAKQL